MVTIITILFEQNNRKSNYFNYFQGLIKNSPYYGYKPTGFSVIKIINQAIPEIPL